MSSFSKWVFGLCILGILACGVVKCSVTFDRKALIINGQRRILISGSIHYPRSTPEMWEDLISKAKDGGLDVIETYVFWNVHEPSPGNVPLSLSLSLKNGYMLIFELGLTFAQSGISGLDCKAADFSLTMSCVDSGFPVWLKYVPGISFRTDNEPFKMAMKGFTEKIVDMMKAGDLYESQGGPIILSQIENEYGPQAKKLGNPGHRYMTWAAKMAVGLDTGVPWVMCKEDDAPDPVINSCNGFYCDAFTPNKPYKPAIWTEAWSGWFTEFGGPIYERPVKDLAFSVAKFIQNGGSFVNYYMYHGGTNFGRSAGGPFITTSYDYDAPLDEYGLIRQPKYGHLKELHKAVKLCEKALVSADPTVTSLGNLQQAHVYSSKSGDCAAFLSNYDTNSTAKVMFDNMHYILPPWSISILPDCKTVAFNTAKVEVQTSRLDMLPSNSKMSSWETYNEDLNSSGDGSSFSAVGLLEQINVTRDASDYLWYTTSVDVDSSESSLHGGELPTLLIQSAGHTLHVFVNGELCGSGYGTREKRRFTFRGEINLCAGSNRISLLSVAVGLPNGGGHFETYVTGVQPPIVLQGLDRGKLDLSSVKWTYKVGLKGETMKLVSPNSVASVDWAKASSLVAQKDHPLAWHKTYFDTPDGDEPLALDMSTMGKGELWVNGESLGRYWTEYAAGNCNGCSYAGVYKPPKCQIGCGKPTQRWYHLPRSWLKPKRNLLVLFEELGGDPKGITLVKRSVTTVCADVTEYHPKIHIFHQVCQLRNSFGNLRKLSARNMPCSDIIRHLKEGKQRCSVTVSNSNFVKDPCPNVFKRLSVEAICAPQK
ncbi:hypothetical protein SASPL_143559 [Salvia splendens]|uniref:Beta-galactosidase n=1 Tax=Salvia splendens TaxID=180675 RepID=A0A8X8Z9V2_SALSN|nr:hypothetical protein SASPL_143559 [Salvia splendens]